MGYSNYLKDKILDKVTNRTDFTLPATCYIAWCTTAGDDNTLGTEPSGGGYARTAVAMGTGMFASATGTGARSNLQEIVSAVSTAAWASGAAFVSAFLMDAASGGNILMRATIPVGNQQAITAANQQLVLPIGSLTFTQNN